MTDINSLIFFEKSYYLKTASTKKYFIYRQSGNLCAQHSLNSLLQNSYFTAVDLAELARSIDKSEFEQLGIPQQRSENYDDSGFFSIQVMQEALKVWNLELIDKSTAVVNDPSCENAYICNLNQHWFTIRKFGNSNDHWYNLDSTQNQPSHISQTYLSEFLAAVQEEGYYIFVVKGSLPQCNADYFMLYSSATDQPTHSFSDDDEQLNKVLQLSKVEDDGTLEKVLHMSVEDPVKAVIAKSLLESNDETILQKILEESRLEYDTQTNGGEPVDSKMAGSSNGYIAASMMTSKWNPIENEDVELNKAIEESLKRERSPHNEYTDGKRSKGKGREL